MGVKIEGVSFRYKGSAQKALSEISFDVRPGELLFVVGGNGSGKSTLLSCISGLASNLDEGHIDGIIKINNVNITAYGDKVPAGLVLQDSDTYLFEEVSEEIAYPLLNSGIPSSEAQERIYNVAELFGIKHLLHRKMSSLSGGERQKVAIATVLVTSAEILLLDDPVEQLDPEAAHELLKFLRNLTSQGRSVIVTARRLDYARVYADRIIFLRNGFVVENGILRSEVTGLTSWHLEERRDSRVSSLEKLNLEKSLPVINFKKLSHLFTDGGGIQDIDLTVEPGEIVAVMGPNGAGKSTLVKHCLRLLVPQQGKGFIFGEDLSQAKTWQLAKRIGMLFQNPDDQIFNERVDKEVAWSLKTKGITWEKALVEARNVLGELDLLEVSAKHPYSLPQFQRQLVAVASVLVTKPELIIFDEPTKSMDVELISKVMKLVLQRRGQGATVIIITHDPALAWFFADRTVLLVNGRLLGAGSTREVLLDKNLTKKANLSGHPFLAELERGNLAGS